MLEEMGNAAKKASYQLSRMLSAEKNQLLLTIAKQLEQYQQDILSANAQDMQQAKIANLSSAIQDRLLLTPARLMAIINDIHQVCQLADPIGQIIDGRRLDSGLQLERKRVPLGVIGVIYEARPNVTVDITSLCLKTGNSVILRGGKETLNTNKAIVEIIHNSLRSHGLSPDAVQLVTNTDRALIVSLLKLNRYIDMLIPRGGEALQELCRQEALMPVMSGGIGICHTFVDESADIDSALKIIINAKTQRPSTCNTLETLLVHQAIAKSFLPKLGTAMAECGVTLHANAQLLEQVANNEVMVQPLTNGDLSKEWLSLDLNVVIVDDIDAAIEHIRTYSSSHSDAILTRDMKNATWFVQEVDSAAVYVNASTRFTDGAQFGLGAEVAVSTQKMHARGPMGLEALTTYKWIGYGQDLIRS